MSDDGLLNNVAGGVEFGRYLSTRRNGADTIVTAPDRCYAATGADAGSYAWLGPLR